MPQRENHMNECSDTSDKQSVAAVSSTYQRPSYVPVGSRCAPTGTVRCWLPRPGDSSERTKTCANKLKRAPISAYATNPCLPFTSPAIEGIPYLGREHTPALAENAGD